MFVVNMKKHQGSNHQLFPPGGYLLLYNSTLTGFKHIPL